VTQCELSGIEFVESLPTAEVLAAEYSLVMDAIFGFSFKRGGGIRAPFDAILATLAATEARELPHLDL
jgi:NAD(P)H-hydrate repair Nnr-like enzyme with NAD(P)H-hydrate epimerase domain